MQTQNIRARSDVVLELSEAGVDQIRIYADAPEEREAGLRLLIGVGPELRALESALLRSRKTDPSEREELKELSHVK